MACVKILILFGLLSLGFLIPGIKSTPEVITSPIMVDDSLSYLNILRDTRDDKNLSFNLLEDDYLTFIELIRSTLRDTETHGIPVLLPQLPETSANARWLDIVLTADTSSITVRLEQSNLYVRGYRRSGDDFFWEFSDTQLITASHNLLFSGSYSGSRDIPLGYYPLVNAIHNLDRLNPPTGENSSAVARSLLVIIQMIAEAARFRTISDHIAGNYYNNVVLDDRMIALQNGWGRLSTAVLEIGEDPTPDTLLPNIRPNNPTRVTTFGDALLVLGLLLITRPRDGSRETDYGRCLMNLEYVRVNNIVDEEHRANNVFGTVRVDDRWYTYDFIRRERPESERLPPGAFATLTEYDHSFPVSGMDAFTVNVTLFEGSRGTSDDKIAEGYILWDRFVESVTFANYDKHLQRVITGDYGDVTVGYSVLSYALGVTVQVVLIDSDKEFTSEIYGTLTASQDLPGSAALAPITLFDKSSGDRVELRRNESFPLTRTVFAASTATQLTISADLWDHDYLSLDDNIALGNANFAVRPGKQNINIKGRYGEVEVVVTCA